MLLWHSSKMAPLHCTPFCKAPSLLPFDVGHGSTSLLSSMATAVPVQLVHWDGSMVCKSIANWTMTMVYVGLWQPCMYNSKAIDNAHRIGPILKVITVDHSGQMTDSNGIYELCHVCFLQRKFQLF